MNYYKAYNDIICFRQQCKPINCYTEKHHIIPKSLGGSDDKCNIVELTAREHFVCHLLLSKMYPKHSVPWIKMMKAFCCMMVRHSTTQERVINSRWYAYWKENFSKAQSLHQSGNHNSQYGKVWICNEELRQNKSIKITTQDQYLNSGWRLGRVLDWDSYFEDKNRIRKNQYNSVCVYHKQTKRYTKIYKSELNTPKAKEYCSFHPDKLNDYISIYNLHTQGLSYSKIGKLLGLSGTVVEMRYYTYRDKLNKNELLL